MKSSKAIKGSKSGGSKRKSVEAPDSLYSIANAKFIDLISEGEIEGFPSGENFLRDIYFDETPIENPDGTRNFKSLQIEARTGTQNQEHIPGFAEVENEMAVGVELRADTPWTRSFTNRELSAVRVRIAVPSLSKANQENGDITGYKVDYAIDLATDGGPFVEVMRSAFNGKTSSPYERSHRIDLPRSTVSGWLLRVRRLTPDDASAYIQDTTQIASVTELIDGKFRYPMSALVGVQIDASQFQSVPTRSYLLKGRRIKVPTNYDPVTRTYTGIWDGTFKTAWSDNPAWVYYDMATHPRYGLGRLVAELQIDKFSLYEIGQYCDELVPDGFGGTEPRMTCNLYLQQAEDAWKVMSDLSSVFRGISYWAGGQIVPTADKPADPVYTYTNANVVDGTFTYQSSGRRARHSAVMVSYHDMENFGKLRTDYYDSPSMIARFGYQLAEIVAVGCTSRGQAQRFAKWYLMSEEFLTNTCSWSVGPDGTFAVPGQIVRVADKWRAGRRMGGRIAAGALNSVTLDVVPSPAPAPGDTITVILPTGVSQSRTISSVVGRVVTPTVNFTAVPTKDSAWAIESNSLKNQLFRVLSVQDGGDGTFQLTGLQHNPTIFDAVDLGEPISVPPTSALTASTQQRPNLITIASTERAGEVVAMPLLTASWVAPPGAVRYEVQWRKDNGEWTPIQQVMGTTVEHQNPFPGSYEVKVQAVNAVGVVSIPAISEPFVLDDQTLEPGFVAPLEQGIAAATDAAADAEQSAADAVAAVAQEVQDREAAIAAEAAARLAAINAEAAARQAQADALQAQIADITGSTDAWDSATTYPPDDLVTFGGKLYRALTTNTNKQPDLNPADWELVGNYASMDEAIAAALQMSSANASRLDDVGTNGWTLESVASNLAGLQSTINHATTGLSATYGLAASVKTRIDDTGEGKSLETVASDVKTLGTAVNHPSTGLSTKASQSSVTAVTNRLNTIPGGTGFSLESLATKTSQLDSAVNHASTGLATRASASDLTAVTNRLNTVPGGTGFSLETIATKTSQLDSAVNHASTGLATRASASDLTAVVNRLNTVPGGTGFSLESLATKTSQLDSAVNHASTGLASKASIATTNAISQRLNNTGTNNWTLEQTASNLNTVKLAVENPTTGLASKASISNFNTLKGRVDDVNGSGQSLEAMHGTVVSLGTSKADVTVINAIEASIIELEGIYNRNLIPNAGFAVDARGWWIDWNSHGDPNVMLGRSLISGAQVIEAGKTINNLTTHRLGSTPAGRFFAATSPLYPITPDALHFFSRSVAMQNGAEYMTCIRLYDAAGVALNSNEYAGATLTSGSGKTGGTSRSGWQYFSGSFTTPSNARFFSITTRLYTGTGTVNNARAWMMEPMLERAAPGQTVASPFNLGQSEAKAEWNLVFDVNKNVSGMQFTNDGRVSDFRVRADAFEVVTSEDGTGLALDQTRMDRVFGNAAIYEGDPFGTDNLVMWIGPKSIARASANKSNGTFWIASNGTQGGGAMIGGALPVYMKSASSTALAVIEATTSSFPRASGMSRVITATMSSNGANGVKFANHGTGTEKFYGSFVVEVSRDGGSWTQVGLTETLTVPVQRVWNGSETEYSTTPSRPSQNFTAIDSDASGTNLRYRVRETTQLGQPTGWGAPLQHTVSIRVEQQQIVE